VPEQKKSRWIAAVLVAVGYVLSPLSWWNDALVNLPLAWLIASAVTRLLPGSFEAAILVAYWLTNLAGFLLMYLGGKKFSQDRRWHRRNTLLFIGLSTAYAVGIYLLAHFGVVKPLF
jgi:hypothetical protein